MNPELRKHITGILLQHTGESFSSAEFSPVSGGSINHTMRISADSHKFFCKINAVSKYPGLFEKEASALAALAQTACIRTPGVIGIHEFNDQQILLLEWIDDGRRTTNFWKLFGEQLAKLHLWKNANAGQPISFGFTEDNYMGALPQQNTPMDNWCTFFTEARLKPQLELAHQRKLIPAATLSAFDSLYRKLEEIFPPEPPSLLHGDLWSGNFLCTVTGEPVLIDPAVYYGHRSIDLGMTTLFGGFGPQFYESYTHWYPLPSNHREQWEVCNLYPLLIHLNLFGSTYLSSIEATLRRFR